MRANRLDVTMESTYCDYIIRLVESYPGELTPADVIKRLRLHFLSIGEDDPGLANARRALEEAINEGEIQVFCEVLGLLEKELCYPGDYKFVF